MKVVKETTSMFAAFPMAIPTFFTALADSTGERTRKYSKKPTSAIMPSLFQFIAAMLEDPGSCDVDGPNYWQAEEVSATDPVDSILLVSFGGPEKPEDVMPFLRNVTKGRNVPDARLQVVAEQYAIFGGRSPINDQNVALMDALAIELKSHGLSLPIYWGNRNWTPYLHETLEQMANDGRKHALAFVTSAYSSYSACRQYREDIGAAQSAVGSHAPHVAKLRQFFNHPGFLEPMIENTRAGIEDVVARGSETIRVIFTAHSIPLSMASNSRYESQLLEASRLVMEGIEEAHDWDLVFQSRSGAPHVPWLEPDINDHLEKMGADGIDGAVVVPIGFISDHMEVMYDLDTRAAETARRIGIQMKRVRTVGTDPRFISMICGLIEEALDPDLTQKACGLMGPVSCLGPSCCLDTAKAVASAVRRA
jgi:protoporphyrin/coproporphyrin ferrochelatase